MVCALDSGSGCPFSSPGRGNALCSWTRHFTLIVPLSTQVYKGVPVNLLLGVTLQWTSIPSRVGGGGGGGGILPVASCYGNWFKLQPHGPLGLSVDLALPSIRLCKQKDTVSISLIE